MGMSFPTIPWKKQMLHGAAAILYYPLVNNDFGDVGMYFMNTECQQQSTGSSDVNLSTKPWNQAGFYE